MEKEEKIEALARRIWNECYCDLLSPDQINYMLDKYLSKEAIKKSSNTFVLLENKAFYAYEEHEDHIFLSKLYVDKEYRNLGIAKEIINDLLKYHKSIILTVNKKNKAYFAYLKMGFEVIDSVKTDIGNGFIMDDYIMKKEVVFEKAYAKINLGLKVKGKRNDGYHEIESMMVPIDLYDEMIFTNNQRFLFESSIEDNIVNKAYNLVKETYNIKKEAQIILTKKIPLSAGLAGGSADASATIRGLNRLWNLGMSNHEMETLALKLGSDTVFCLYNKPAIVKGRGEVLEYVSYCNDKYLIIVNPLFPVSTKRVFDSYNNEQGKNDLEPVTMRLYPNLKVIKDNLEKEGLAFKMTGSGPTLFAMCDSMEFANYMMDKYKNDYLVVITKIFL